MHGLVAACHAHLEWIVSLAGSLLLPTMANLVTISSSSSSSFFLKKKKKKIQSEKRRNGTLKIEKGNLSHYIWGKKEHEGKEWECGLMEFL
jgi:hypothetical protein